MPSVKCEFCGKLFSRSSHIKRHLENNSCSKARENCFEVGLFKCLEGCNVSFATTDELGQHLNNQHHLEISKNYIEFNKFEEFEAWLQQLEKKENVRYIKTRGTRRSADKATEKTYLYCSRTGKERLQVGHRKRSERSQGSSKLNCGCTSQVTVTKHINSGKCHIEYCSTHYGHKEDIHHLRISKQSRMEISEKLLMGIPANRILNSTRDSIGEHLNRDDILTKKDIWNIKTAYNVDIQDGCRHPDDSTSVDLWVKECSRSECNPVLFFKRQGDLSTTFNLHPNDFCLIFMNITQIEIFKKFGNNIICIDGTHGMNAYDFELTTVLVLDEFGEGFPIAFMFSNRKDTYIYECFFTCIQKATFCNEEEPFPCNTFMTDITNVYINAWVAVMGAPKKQLYCSWHVDRAWQHNLSKVTNEEKRKWVYKTLKYLQTCLQEDIFEKELHSFLELTFYDNETKHMHEYLVNNYYTNRFQWAYCYRKLCGINTNMHLESMHKVIKYVYLDGKKIKRLDKSINALQKYLRDKTIDRIIKLTKGKSCEHLTQIKNRHRIAISNPCNFTLIEKDVYETYDEKNNNYLLKKVKETICCSLSCNYCNICVHTYECTCLDYSVKSTICKHIHGLILNTNTIPRTTENSNVSTEINDYNNVEVNKLVNNLSRDPAVAFKKSPDELLHDIKIEAHHLLTNLNTLNYTSEEKPHLLKHLKSLNSLGASSVESTFDSFLAKSSFPANKKIEKQKFFSTKKKREKKNCIFKKPSSTERTIIQSTLLQSIFISDTPEHDHAYFKKQL